MTAEIDISRGSSVRCACPRRANSSLSVCMCCSCVSRRDQNVINVAKYVLHSGQNLVHGRLKKDRRSFDPKTKPVWGQASPC